MASDGRYQHQALPLNHGGPPRLSRQAIDNGPNLLGGGWNPQQAYHFHPPFVATSKAMSYPKSMHLEASHSVPLPSASAGPVYDHHQQITQEDEDDQDEGLDEEDEVGVSYGFVYPRPRKCQKPMDARNSHVPSVPTWWKGKKATAFWGFMFVVKLMMMHQI